MATFKTAALKSVYPHNLVNTNRRFPGTNCLQLHGKSYMGYCYYYYYHHHRHHHHYYYHHLFGVGAGIARSVQRLATG